MHNILIRNETPADHREVENLVRESFWNVYRPGCLEHYVLHVLRDDPAFVKELDFVMEKDGRIIGQNMFMRAFITADDGRQIPIMTMGPSASPTISSGRATASCCWIIRWSRRKNGAAALCALKATSASMAKAVSATAVTMAFATVTCRRAPTTPSSCAVS